MAKILLGSEVIIISVDDARKLVNARPVSRNDLETLQQHGALSVLEDLSSAVRRYDYGEEVGDG